MKSAPMECPKCGETKGWRCLNDPAGREMKRGTQAVIQVGFGLLGLGIAKLLSRRSALKYHCDSCGYEAVYKPD